MSEKIKEQFEYNVILNNIEWKIILKISFNSLLLILQQALHIYQQQFNYLYLTSFQQFKNKKNIKDIIFTISTLLEEKKFEIEEEKENINLLLNKKVKLIIPKNEKEDNPIIEGLIKEMKLIKEEINKLKDCKNEIEILKKKILQLESFHNINKGKSEGLNKENIKKLDFQIEKKDNKLEKENKLEKDLKINITKEEINLVEKTDKKKDKLIKEIPKINTKIAYNFLKQQIDIPKVNVKLYSERNNNKLNPKIIKNKEDFISYEMTVKKANKDDDLRRKIINCYEECKKNNPNWNWNNIKGTENGNEIEENCEIFLNDEKLLFHFDHKFLSEGKYSFKIKNKKLLTNTNFLFSQCSSLIFINLSNFNSNNIINMSGMFSYCSSLSSINFSNFNTSKVINMSSMFLGCSSLINLDLSSFNTNNVINMNSMFSFCSSLTSLNLSNFNTSKVNNMRSMFYNCSSLQNLNISNFNTSNVINLGCMFSSCSSLTNLNLSNFNTNNVNDMSEMFSSCSSMNFLNLSNFNTSNVTNMRRMFFGLNKSCEIIAKDKKLFNIINN